MTSTPRSPQSAPSGDVELLERLAAARRDLLAQVGQVIVGQRDVLDGILTAIFAGGHALLVIQSKRKVLALTWGDGLKVESRGIVG